MEIKNSLDKFSWHYKNALKTALATAAELGQQTAEPAHLLYGLLQERGSIASEFLHGLKIDSQTVRDFLQTRFSSSLTDMPPLADFSLSGKKIIERSVTLAWQNKHLYIGTEHLLAALLSAENRELEEIFTKANLKQADVALQAGLALKSTGKFTDILNGFKESEKKFEEELTNQENSSALDFFGRNLCLAEIQKKIDPVIGRETEISRLIEILCRRNKNNPLLLGDPGVGKPAIVEGLAKLIAENKAPEALSNKIIYAIDLASVVAGTSYRGEFEARLKEIILEAAERPEVILFIDEIHQLIGAGSASGSMDAANILKPALARGEIKVIGATTYADYRKSIENDQALGRRFQIVKVVEPSEAETAEILYKNKSYFEAFHGVGISEQAILSAIKLSQKYLGDKHLPDKAIDLIDEALAREKISRPLTRTEMTLKELTRSIAELEAELNNRLLEESFNSALELREQISSLDKKIKELKTKWQSEKILPLYEIGEKHIAEVVAKTTGIPAEQILQNGSSRVLKLEAELNRNIIGQKAAIKDISYYLKRAHAGLTPETRPLASLLFVGPSGSGKTYTAKMLAEKFFGNSKALIKIDMSEFAEKFNASKLIGAPAGYVGFKESGLLTEKVKRQPYSLILLDEIEKANVEIYDLLLQVFDEGSLTDASGAKIDFKNTIIIMTSNLGSQFYQGKSGIGFTGDNLTEKSRQVAQEAQKWFRPEFISRLDQIICFNELTEKDLIRIAELEIQQLTNRLKREKSINLKYAENLAETIVQKMLIGNNKPDARAIKSQISGQLEKALVEIILKGEKSGKILRVKAKNGIISLS